MAMTACYSNYGLLGAVSQRQRQQQQHQSLSQQPQLSTQPTQLIPIPQPSRLQSAQVPQKDFSVPLHVDCSVEYELPNQAKPPPGARVEPLLLMIHPCYFRKIESEQRRSPFINNMPNSSSSSSSTSSSSSRNSTQNRRSSRNTQQQINQTSNAYSSTSTSSVQQNQSSLHHNPNPNHNHNHSHSSHSHNHSSHNSHSHSQQHTHNSHHSQSQMERQKLEQNPQIHQRSLSQQAQQQKMSQMSQQAYYPANSNNTTTNTNNTNSNDSSLADIRLCLDNWEHSQMAAIPRDFQAGLPDATPNNTHHYRDDKLNALNGKYRQYLRSHRLHPYLMASATAFPQLTSSVFH